MYIEKNQLLSQSGASEAISYHKSVAFDDKIFCK